MTLRRLGAALALAWLGGAPAFASQAQRWGLDSTSASRATLGVVEGAGPYAPSYNPALLAASPRSQVGLAYTAASLDFEPVGRVVVDSPNFRTQDGQFRTSPVQLPSTSMGVFALGATWSGFEAFRRRVGFGLTISGPLGTLGSFRSKTPYDFQTLRYGTADGQFQTTFATGFALIPGRLFAGVGTQLYLTGAGDAEAAINSVNPTGRVNLDFGLRAALRAGLLARFGATSVGLAFRQRVRPNLRQGIVGSIEVAGVEVLAQPLELSAVLYAEPETWEAEVSHDFHTIRASAGLRYERWSATQPAYLLVAARAIRGGMRHTAVTAPALRDTWSPATSVAVPLSQRFEIVGGYRWQPTAAPASSGPTNVLDGSVHIASLGVSHALPAGTILPSALRWGLSVQRHWLEGTPTSKEAADFIGAPGYQVRAQGLAVSLGVQADL